MQAEKTPQVDESLAVASIEIDSRLVKPGSLFFAMEVGNSGRLYCQDAMDKGACAVVSRAAVGSLPTLIVPSPEKALALASSAFFDEPQKGMKLVGITGTDGKSTTAWFLYSLLLAKGVKAALLSTVMVDDGSGPIPSPWRQSTPEAPQLYQFLSRCRANNVELTILECTSHALSSQASRLSGLEFELCIFTTLTEEHLEFHKTMEAYIDAKLNLARQTKPASVCLVLESNAHRDQISSLACSLGLEVQLYGRQSSKVTVLHQDLDGLELEAQGKMAHFCYGPLFFLDNALGALEAASRLNAQVSLEDLSCLKPLSGRFEVLHLGSKLAIIDFAHTADAFASLFSQVRSICPDKSFVAVFGSGGFRDKVKRPAMGKCARAWTSRMILTEEDPRDEGTVAIAMDIDPEARIISTRESAIFQTIHLLKKNEIAFFLGKGHESSIEVDSGHKIPWNEKAKVLEAYKKGRLYRQKAVTLLYGGQSPEHEVSISSASTMYEKLRQCSYSVEAVKITKGGKWIRTGSVTTSDKGLPYLLGSDDNPVFPCLHGIRCEDGFIARILEKSGIPFWGCGSVSSAIGMDKRRQRQLCKLPTTAYEAVSFLRDDVQLPLVVKPNGSGSSVAVRLVRTKEDLAEAFEEARHADPMGLVLLEKPVEEAIDIEVGILQGPEGLITLGPGFIKGRAGVLSYDEKYSGKGPVFKVPAPISESLAEQARQWALEVFRTLGCRGLSRVDFLYEPGTGRLVFNEINTMPGLTLTSHYPVLLESQGLDWDFFFKCMEVSRS